ncbi:hypothetical protein [uncultured Mediterranean phage]|nr:hypothetical protein [uncultured Mediterranean phage]
MATNIVLKRSATQGATPGTSDLELGELALNTYDGKMYMKKTVSGSSSIVELTGTLAASSSAFAYESFKYTASSNQTTFTGSDADSKTLAYTAGQIQVYLNGVLLDASDYTASNGSSVVLGSGASSGSILMVLNFSGTNPFDYFKYTATNAQTSFSGNDANSNSLIYTVGNITVHLNGVLLDASDYTATSGTSVVLASGASTGDILVIHEFNETALTDVSADTTPQLGGDLDVNGSDIVSTSNANIDIIPHGTGNVNLGTDTVGLGTSGENVTVTTIGTGDITLSTNSGTNSGSIVIADGANNDITLTPNGTGDVVIDGLKYPQADGSANQVLKTDGSGQLAFTTISSDEITDADGDTKIQVEESSDEDTIRFDIAGTEQIVLADGVLKPTTDNDIDLGTSSLEFKDAFFDGTVTTDALVADTADINGGTVDGATVGANSASSGAFTTISASSNTDLNGTLNISGHVSLDGSANELRFYEGSNYVGFEAPSLSADQIWVLPTADGSSGQMLKTDGSGTLSWATASSTVTGLTDTTISSVASGDYLIYNGSAWINQAQASNARIATMTGDNSDTTLTLPVSPLTENAVQVYWDGVYQHKDNWAISGTTLTFSTAPGTGVKVEAVVGSQTNILYGNDVAIDTMTGDASDTTLSLSVTPSNENHVNVYFDGVYQSKGNFSLSGSTITFSTAPPTGVVVEAVSNQAVSVGTATGIAASAITGLTEVTAADADHVIIYDASGSAVKKSLVSDLIQTGEEISDIVGAMVSSNTETGITVTYQDADNTIDFALGAAQTTITSLLATDIKIGEDDQTKIDFETADEIHFYAANAHQVKLIDGAIVPVTDNDIDLGTSSLEFKDAFFDGTVTSDAFAGPLTGDVTGNVSGSAATVTTAAQSAITSLGTLTGLTVNGATVFNENSADVDFRVESNGEANMLFVNGGDNTVLIGSNTSVANTAGTGALQVLGTGGGDTTLTIGRFSANAAPPTLAFTKSRNATIGSNTIIQDGDNLGQIVFSASDGDDMLSSAAKIEVEVDGTPGANDLPGRMGFYTTADGGTGSTERMRINSAGDVGIGTTTLNKFFNLADPNEGAEALKLHFEASNSSDKWAIYAYDRTNSHYADLSLGQNSIYMYGSNKDVNIASSARISQVALTSSSNSVAWNAKAAGNAYHVTTENTTFAAPSNAVEGAVISVELAQGGTARTIAWNTVFEFAASTAPTVTATANKTDIFTFRYNGSVWQEIGRVQNMAQT